MSPALCDSALTATRKLAIGCVLAVVLALAGCGGDEESPPTTPAAASPETETAPSEPTEPEPEPEPPVTETATEPTESPEDMPGGAGDEEPARTLALFTARDGRIRPRVVRVPAFISIQVELRSADGAEYALRFGDTTMEAGGELNSVSTTIDGLRPGKAITGQPSGPGNPVRIEATAEPGP